MSNRHYGPRKLTCQDRRKVPNEDVYLCKSWLEGHIAPDKDCHHKLCPGYIPRATACGFRRLTNAEINARTNNWLILRARGVYNFLLTVDVELAYAFDSRVIVYKLKAESERLRSELRQKELYALAKEQKS